MLLFPRLYQQRFFPNPYHLDASWRFIKKIIIWERQRNLTIKFWYFSREACIDIYISAFKKIVRENSFIKGDFLIFSFLFFLFYDISLRNIWFFFCHNWFTSINYLIISNFLIAYFSNYQCPFISEFYFSTLYFKVIVPVNFS